MTANHRRKAAVIASCAAIFWPGSFIFGFPGVMGPHWQEAFGAGSGEMGKCLFFILAGVGIFMYPTGRCQEKIGTAGLAAFGALLCGGSAVMVGYARSITMVYVWAFMVGVSSALIYIPALTVVQRCYPRRRGLVSGVVNMVFGLSAAPMSPVFVRMQNSLGTSSMTVITGLAALAVGLAASGFISGAQSADTAPPNVQPAEQNQHGSLTIRESIGTRAFWCIWCTWALAGAAGISMVTHSVSFGLAQGLSMHKAVLLLTAFNLTNGLGRLVSGHLSDMFGRNGIMSVAFIAAGGAYLLLPRLPGIVAWTILVALVGFAFGTLFAVSAPLTSDCFGMKHFGAVFGLIFTAYGFVAGPLGPWLSGHLLDATGSDYHTVFLYLAMLYFVSAVLIWCAKPPKPAGS